MKNYKPLVSVVVNKKGVLDIDSVKGCFWGIKTYPNGGCYGLCYAAKIAARNGFCFKKSVSRNIPKKKYKQLRLFDDYYDYYGVTSIFNTVNNHKLEWFRLGTMGDPCHDWQLTYDICEWLGRLKVPVIVTKHWITIDRYLLLKLKTKNVVFNTSISALDTPHEINHRLYQFNRIRKHGIKSVLRIVSCEFGNTKIGKRLNINQDRLFKNKPFIDNPLRISPNDKRVLEGHIITKKVKDLNRLTSISIFNNETYIGNCVYCPDQCGVN